MPLPEGAENIPGVIIPRKAVNELRKLIEDDDGQRRGLAVGQPDPLRLRRRDADLEADRRQLPGLSSASSRPTTTRSLEVDRKTFRDAVDRVSTISSEKSRAVKLEPEERPAHPLRHERRARQRGRGAGSEV